MADLDLTEIREGLVVRPGDTLVLRIKRSISMQDAERMYEQIQRRLGADARVLICDFDGELAVMRADQEGTDGRG